MKTRIATVKKNLRVGNYPDNTSVVRGMLQYRGKQIRVYPISGMWGYRWVSLDGGWYWRDEWLIFKEFENEE